MGFYKILLLGTAMITATGAYAMDNNDEKNEPSKPSTAMKSEKTEEDTPGNYLTEMPTLVDHDYKEGKPKTYSLFFNQEVESDNTGAPTEKEYNPYEGVFQIGRSLGTTNSVSNSFNRNCNSGVEQFANSFRNQGGVFQQSFINEDEQMHLAIMASLGEDVSQLHPSVPANSIPTRSGVVRPDSCLNLSHNSEKPLDVKIKPSPTPEFGLTFDPESGYHIEEETGFPYTIEETPSDDPFGYNDPELQEALRLSMQQDDNTNSRD